MRIQHVITDTDRRGAQVFACDLDAALSAQGHTSTVVALAPGQVGGLDVPALGSSRLSLGTLRALRKSMRDADVTVAHGSSTLPACRFANIGARRTWVARQISETRFWANSRRRRARVHWYLRGATAVVALAPSAAGDLQNLLRVPGSKISVAPNGIPVRSLAPAAPAERLRARAQFGLVDRATVLSVAALVPEKGVDRVIQTIGALPDAQLLVAGDGPERENLEALAQRVAPDRVVFAGSISRIQEAYAAADVLVLASRGGDSMPAALIEAGFCGLPAVATTVGAIGETIVDGVTGVLVRPENDAALEDAVRDLLTDGARAQRMGADARRRYIDLYEIGPVAERWVEVLEQAMTRASRAR